MSVRETNLRQGDLLPGCWIPEYPADFAEQTDEARIIEADQADLIVITQTCPIKPPFPACRDAWPGRGLPRSVLDGRVGGSD